MIETFLVVETRTWEVEDVDDATSEAALRGRAQVRAQQSLDGP